MPNAHVTTEIAYAVDRLENFNLAEHTPQRSGTAATVNRSARRAARFWLNVLETATAPLLAVTNCNYPRECRTGTAN